jgi:hypothetical protein
MGPNGTHGPPWHACAQLTSHAAFGMGHEAARRRGGQAGWQTGGGGGEAGRQADAFRNPGAAMAYCIHAMQVAPSLRPWQPQTTCIASLPLVAQAPISWRRARHNGAHNAPFQQATAMQTRSHAYGVLFTPRSPTLEKQQQK